MGESYMDIVLFALLAGVLGYRLYVTLGQRPDSHSDSPPFERSSSGKSPMGRSATGQGSDDPVKPAQILQDGLAESPENRDADRSDPATREAVDKVRALDPDFDLSHFLSGASKAYEMIHAAYIQSDREVLDQLIDGKALKTFHEAIEGRRSRGETLHAHLVGIDEATLGEVDTQDREIRITVDFNTTQVTALFDSDHRVIMGDIDEKKTIRERWTFVRLADSDAPGWKLRRRQTL